MKNPSDAVIELAKNATARALKRKIDDVRALEDRSSRLIETCKLNGIDSPAYLTDIPTRIANVHPINRIDELLPWALALEAEDRGSSSLFTRPLWPGGYIEAALNGWAGQASLLPGWNFLQAVIVDELAVGFSKDLLGQLLPSERAIMDSRSARNSGTAAGCKPSTGTPA
jgi:IS66 C-terminal element